jgi:hypothetical protein
MRTAAYASLDSFLRDWLQSSSGFFIDSSIGFAEDLSGAPLGAQGRRAALPTGQWVLLERGGKPFVLAGIEPRSVAGRRCFTIFEYCVNGQNRVSFWECVGPSDWAFFSDGSFVH